MLAGAAEAQAIILGELENTYHGPPRRRAITSAVRSKD